METAGVEPTPLRCKRGALPSEPHPQMMRPGGVEPPQHKGAAFTAWELTSCSASAQRKRVAGRARTGACRAHNPGCFRLHHGHHEAGTTGLEPAASRLTSECSS